jgi:hypothetical protein
MQGAQNLLRDKQTIASLGIPFVSTIMMFAESLID